MYIVYVSFRKIEQKAWLNVLEYQFKNLGVSLTWGLLVYLLQKEPFKDFTGDYVILDLFDTVKVLVLFQRKLQSMPHLKIFLGH